MFSIEIIGDPLVKLIAFISIAFVLLKTPFIGRYVSIINTLIHEFGHALVALITFGKVDKIELFANSSGKAWSSNRFWIGRVLTSLAGYTSSSAIAYLFLYLIKNNEYNYVFAILFIIMIFSFVFWIRNLYGFIWIITFSNLAFFLIKFDNSLLNNNILLFITSIIFVESILSSFTILKLSFTQPTDAGDATSLWKSVIFIPSPVWGAFFFLQSIVLGYMGIALFF